MICVRHILHTFHFFIFWDCFTVFHDVQPAYEFIIRYNAQVGIKWIRGGGRRQRGIKYKSKETFIPTLQLRKLLRYSIQVGIKWIPWRQRGIKYPSNETFCNFLAQKTAEIQWISRDKGESNIYQMRPFPATQLKNLLICRAGTIFFISSVE